MPHVTTILGNEAGIQYQGVKDASSVLGVPLINGLIVGQFKRGRLDRPMTITLENIRGTLGHDPDNPDYIAVMDALSAGVPSVQVMRVLGVNLVCTNTPYYAYGYDTSVSFNGATPEDPNFNVRLPADEHNALLEKTFNSIQASGDGKELNVIKVDERISSSSPEPAEFDALVILTNIDEMGYRNIHIHLGGDGDLTPYSTLQICALYPIYLSAMPA